MIRTVTTEFARTLSELSEPTAYVGYGGMGSHEHTPFHLASLAECGSPDAADSPGARFLSSVAESVAERFDGIDGTSPDHDGTVYDLASGDTAYEIADSAVPIYTHERWATFVDLAAYQEDVTDLGATADDLTGAAGMALYMIAERLVRALADELSEALDADDEDAEEHEPSPDEEGDNCTECGAAVHVEGGEVRHGVHPSLS